MIVNIIGLPRTGTTVLYQTVFSGVNKLNKLTKYDQFMMKWDEAWISTKQDKRSYDNNYFFTPEFNDLLEKKIDEALNLGTNGHLVIKTHYGHFQDLKRYNPYLYEKLFSIETYDIKIFRAGMFDSVLSNIILTDSTKHRDSGNDFIYNIDKEKGKEYFDKKISEYSYNIDEEKFRKLFSDYLNINLEMYENPLNLPIDDYMLYEELPKTIKGMWESLKISSDDRFKFAMNDDFDVIAYKSSYDKRDLIKNYNRLLEIASEFNGKYSNSNIVLTDGKLTIKGVDF